MLDGFGRTVGTANAAGVSTVTEFDKVGRVKAQSAPFGGGVPRVDTQVQYDGLSRPSLVSRPDGSTVTYAYSASSSPAGQQLTITESVTGSSARSTSQIVQAFGNPDEGRLVQLVDAHNKAWNYSYNGAGQLTQVTPPEGPGRTWTYHADGRLQAETHPESGTTTYHYSGPTLTHTVDARGADGTIHYAYDANGRLTGVDAPGTADDMTLSYDEFDRPSAATNSTAQTSWVYDTAGRLTSRTDVLGGQNFSQTYGYDGSDNLTSITYPLSGRVVNYSYGSHGRLTAVSTQIGGGAATTLASSIAYHPSGAIASFNRPNGQHENISFETNRHRPTHWVSGPLDITYTYDHVSNVTGIDDVRGGLDVNYGYDDLDRLKTVTGYGATSFTYNDTGDRTTAGSATYTYDGARRLTQISGALSGNGTFTYNNIGSLLTDPSGASYTYTALNKLRSVTLGSAFSSYAYDATGERAVRATSDGIHTYVRGPDGQVLAEYVGPPSVATLKREYIYLGGRLLASYGPSATTPPAVSVSVTSPLPASRFVEVDEPVTFRATPTLSSGSVARVDFFMDGALVGTDTVAPFEVTRSDLPVAAHHVVARVVTAGGTAASSTPVGFEVYAVPRVTAVAVSPAVPVQGQTATILVTGNGLACGAVQIDYGDGTVLVYPVQAPGTGQLNFLQTPTHAWAGTGPYTVRATGLGSCKGEKTVTVSPTPPPSDITAVGVTPSQPITWDVEVLTVYGSATCSSIRVDWGDGFHDDYTINGLPWSTYKLWPTPGTYTITATGTGTCVGKASLTVTVTIGPDVSLTGPSAGTYYLPASLNLSATASDPDGSIAEVRFSANGNHLATDTTAPYAYTWSGMAAGTYQLTATARDNVGGERTSAATTVTIATSDITSVSLSPPNPTTWQLAVVTISGSSHCTSIHFNWGDGYTETYNVSGLPWSTYKLWSIAGTYTLTATAQGNCTGQASLTVTIPNQETRLVRPDALAVVAAVRPRLDTAGWTPIFGSASAAGISEGIDGPVARTNRAGIGLDADPDVNNDNADALATDLEHTRLMRRTAGFAPPDLADAVPDIAGGIDDSVLPAAPDDDAPVPQATATLTVDLSGSGSGGVTSSPAGVSCGGSQTSCSAAFATGTSVTLTATPTGGHTFLGWSGACTGTDGCVVSLTGDRLVVATFHQSVTPVVTFYHLDAIGSVRARTDASGTVLARHDYFPFGEDTQLMTGDPNRFGGQELDPESGQHHFHARQYRNIWGRFTGVDPVLNLDLAALEPQRWNRYTYALANPLRFVDPDGLQARPCPQRDTPTFCDTNKPLTPPTVPQLPLVLPPVIIGPGGCMTTFVDGVSHSGCLPDDVTSESTQESESGTHSIGTLADVAILAMSLRGDLRALHAALTTIGRAVFRAGAARGISITARGLSHVVERHTVAGALTAGKSVFRPGEDVAALVRRAAGVQPVRQVGGNFERVIDAGRTIGIDRSTGGPTSVYTVITNAADELITAFPGRP